MCGIAVSLLMALEAAIWNAGESSTQQVTDSPEAAWYWRMYSLVDPYFDHKKVARIRAQRKDMKGAVASMKAYMSFWNTTSSLDDWRAYVNLIITNKQKHNDQYVRAAEVIQEMVETTGSYHEYEKEKYSRYLQALNSDGKLKAVMSKVEEIFSRKLPSPGTDVYSESRTHSHDAKNLIKEVEDVWEYIGSPEFWEQYMERSPILMRPHVAPPPVLSPKDVAQRRLRYITDGIFMKQHAFHNDPPANFTIAESAVVDVGMMERAFAHNLTLFVHRTQNHFNGVNAIAQKLSDATALMVDTVTYISGPLHDIAFLPHHDDNSVYISQQHGSKRWRVWAQETGMLTERSFFGRDKEMQLDIQQLGIPDLDVELRQGDVLYVPRGALHCTSTSTSSEPSLSLTLTSAQQHYLWPVVFGVGAGHAETYSQGVPDAAHRAHSVFRTHWFHATRALAQRNIAFRRTMPRDFWFGDGNKWTQTARKLLHEIVDEMIDGTDFASSIQAMWREERHMDLRSEFQGESTIYTEV